MFVLAMLLKVVVGVVSLLVIEGDMVEVVGVVGVRGVKEGL